MARRRRATERRVTRMESAKKVEPMAKRESCRKERGEVSVGRGGVRVGGAEGGAGQGESGSVMVRRGGARRAMLCRWWFLSTLLRMRGKDGLCKRLPEVWRSALRPSGCRFYGPQLQEKTTLLICKNYTIKRYLCPSNWLNCSKS